MPTLHDAQTRAALRQRLESLRPDSPRAWGKMSVDQMLHHVNLSLECALGRSTVAPLALPLPKSIVKFLVLNVPWPKGAPTQPEWVVGDRHDFQAEHAKCLNLIDEFAAKPLTDDWPVHSTFGTVGSDYYTRLHAKHLDHHLKQFST
jgi:uncharacterized protein DUF1569